MPEELSEAALHALAMTDWVRTDAMSVRALQEWERGSKAPSGPARTLLRAIKGDPDGVRRALAAA